jgi:hypothetical protein
VNYENAILPLLKNFRKLFVTKNKNNINDIDNNNNNNNNKNVDKKKLFKVVEF